MSKNSAEQLPTPNPEDLLPLEQAPDPEVLFVQHVEAIRRGGDAFDQRGKYNYRLMGTMALYGAAGATLLSSENVHASIGAGFVGTLTLLGATLVRINWRDKREHPLASQAYRQDIQEALDAEYELYRIPPTDDDTPPKISMHWMGPHENSDGLTPVEQLERIAALAKRGGVDSLLIRQGILDDITSTVPVGDPQSFKQWLKQHRGLIARGAKKDMVMAAEPDAWLAYAAQGRMPLKPITAYQLPHSTEEILHAAWVRKQIGLSDEELRHPRITIDPKAKDQEGATEVTVRAEDTTPMAINDSYAYQQRHAVGNTYVEDGISKPFRGPALVAAFALAAGTVYGAQATLDSRAADIETHMRSTIAAEQGLQPDDPSITDDMVRDHITDWSVVDGAWSEWRELRRKWPDRLETEGDGKPGTEQPDQTEINNNQISGKIGNVGKPSNATAYDITVINGSPADAYGHWNLFTSSEAISSIAGNQLGINWLRDPGLFATNTPLPSGIHASARRTDSHAPTIIEVNGQAPPFESSPLGILTVGIPNLQGWRVAAANINGNSVSLLTEKDGTYRLGVNEGISPSGRVRYWLVKDEQAVARAVAWAKLSSGYGSGAGLAADEAEIREVLRKNIPGFNTMDPKELASYISSHLDYAYNPWPNKKLQSITGVPELLQLTFDENKANCNVAAQLMVTADPRLNMLFEFKNTDDPLRLSYDEAHARVVDAAGRAYDATPSKLANPETESDPTSPLPVIPLTVGLGVIALGLAANRYRRQLASLVATRYANATTRGSDWSEARVLREAVALTDHVLWSPHPTIIDPAYLRKAGGNTALSPEAAFELLKNPDRHSAPVRKALKELSEADRAHRKALKIARRATKG